SATRSLQQRCRQGGRGSHSGIGSRIVALAALAAVTVTTSALTWVLASSCPVRGDFRLSRTLGSRGQSAGGAALFAQRQGIVPSGGGKVGDEDFDFILDELEDLAQVGETLYPPEVVPEDPWKGVKEKFGIVLVSDIFIIITLSIWFLVGVALRYALGFEPLLATFLYWWDPWIQALLGILFAARIIGIALSNLTDQD
ncbi:unnamed protein product, partial [Polarella glacialis]